VKKVFCLIKNPKNILVYSVLQKNVVANSNDEHFAQCEGKRRIQIFLFLLQVSLVVVLFRCAPQSVPLTLHLNVPNRCCFHHWSDVFKRSSGAGGWERGLSCWFYRGGLWADQVPMFCYLKNFTLRAKSIHDLDFEYYPRIVKVVNCRSVVWLKLFITTCKVF